MKKRSTILGPDPDHIQMKKRSTTIDQGPDHTQTKKRNTTLGPDPDHIQTKKRNTTLDQDPDRIPMKKNMSKNMMSMALKKLSCITKMTKCTRRNIGQSRKTTMKSTKS